MPFFLLALRHLRRFWRLNVAVLLGLTLAAALPASLSSYASAIAAQELKQNLDQARLTERSLLITGRRQAFTNDLFEDLREQLGELFQDRLEVRQSILSADPLPPSEQIEGRGLAITHLNIYSFDQLSSVVRVLEGQLPRAIQMSEFVEPLKPPPIPVVIGASAAEATGLKVGDRLTGNDDFHRLDVVGIVEPLDPRDDLWGGDLSAFGITVGAAGSDEDQVALPLIVASGSIRSISPKTFHSVFPHEVLWRVVLHQRLINADNAQAVHSKLINIQTQWASNNATVSVGLVQILANYVAQLSRVRTTLFLLAAQAFIFVLYALSMLASFVLDRSQMELATLSERGASAGQITGLFALENLILALPAALLLGPGLAYGALRLWAGATGITVPLTLPRESWLLSGVAAGLGWLALVLPVYLAARRSVRDWQQLRARPPRLSAIQRFNLDLFMLVFGGLLYWQLNYSGSFMARRLGDTQLFDPLLLLGPSLLLIATAMVFLRFFPWLLQGAAWVFQRLRGLILSLGLHRLARDPLKPSRVLLLISLTAGLTLFTTVFADSLAHSQAEMAHYVAGADLRISLNQPTNQLPNLPGILTVSPVFRGAIRTEAGQTIELLAVDPTTFAQVAHYRAKSNVTIIVRALQFKTETPEAGDDVLPAIFSFSALPTGKSIGDPLSLYFARQRLFSRVQATIRDFPTLSDPFVIVSLPDLEAQIDLDVLGLRRFASREAWLAVDPAQHENLARHPALQDRILDDAQARLRALQSDALAQGTSGAFRLNTLALALLSVAVFFLVQFFAAQGRVREFSVLRALGLSTRQLLALLVAEGALVLGLGLAAGTLIGYSLARILIPYLSQALSESLSGVTIQHVLVNWPAVARLYGLLILFYGLALMLMLLLLMRVGVHRALRIEDE
jgi:hypothetical protein